MISNTFKKRLALSTALAASFFSYGRRAYAGCYQFSGATYLCAGAETTTQTVMYDNAIVSTMPGFSVSATSGRAITITGDGSLSFTDDNNSLIETAGSLQNALDIRALNDDGASLGSVLVETNGTIIGDRDAIHAYTAGTGGISVELSGSASGTNGYGIFAMAYTNTAGIVAVTTKAGSAVHGYSAGIYVSNFGYGGGVNLNLSGAITSAGDGIDAFVKYQGDLKVDTYAGAKINVLGYTGINAMSRAVTGDIIIHTRDTVSSDGRAVYAYSQSTDILITADAALTGGNDGINAYSVGGSVSVTANDDVTGTGADGIHVKVGGDGVTASVTTAKAHEVAGHAFGIYVLNQGTGDTTVDAQGDVSSTANAAIYVRNTSQGGALTITSAGTLTGQGGIHAYNYGSGNTTVTADGDVNGDIWVKSYGTGGLTVTANAKVSSYYQAIGAFTSTDSTGDLIINTGVKSVLYGHNYAGIYAFNKGTGGMELNIDGAVTNINHSAIDARNFAGAGDATITLGKYSYLLGNDSALHVDNFSDGDITVVANGYIAANINAALRVSNVGAGALSVSANGLMRGYSGIYAFSTNASSAADVTVTLGKNAIVSTIGYGVYAINSGSGKMEITNSGSITANTIDGMTLVNASGIGTVVNKSGGFISGATMGIDVRDGGFDQGIINEAGATITSANGKAIWLSSLDVVTPIIIEGGYISGAIYDTARNAGFSQVEISGDFASDGDFYVSSVKVDAGKTFTLGSGNEIDTYSGTVNKGNIVISQTGNAITGGGLQNDSKAVLDVQQDFSITGGTLNNGTIKIAADANLTLDTMGSGTGTLDFAVTDMAHYGTLDVTGGGIHLAGAAPVKVSLASGAALTAGKAIMLASGDSAITGAGNPGGTLTTVFSSALWKLQIADGTNTSNGVSDVNGANDLWLHVNQNASLSNIAATPGNTNVGNAILSFSSPPSTDLQQLQEDVNMAPDADTLNNILERVQPTVNGHIVTAALDNGVRVQGLADNRMIAWRDGGEGTTGIAAGSATNGSTAWAQGYGQMARQGVRDNIAGYTSDMWGTAVGADTERFFKDTLVGVSFNYAQVNVNASNANRTGTDIESYGVNFYTSTALGANAFLNGQAGYAYNHIEGVRYDVLAPGDTASATYGSNQFSAKALLGRDYAAPHSITVTPNLSAAYTKLLVDGYSETGSGGGLSVRKQNYDTLNLGVGLSTYMDIKYANGTSLKPALHAGYRYAALADRIETTASFIADPANTAFASIGPTPARSTFDGGASLTYSMDSSWDLSANYDYTYKQDYSAHAGMARATVHF